MTEIDAYAERVKLTRHAAIMVLLAQAVGARKVEPETADVAIQIKTIPLGPVAWPSGAVLLPEHTEDPGDDAPLRMFRAAPGSRLKKPKGSK